MAQASTITGRFGGLVVAGTAIPITKWTEKTSKNLADSTDSSCYDAASNQTWNAQQPGTIGQELTLEGNYDLASTSANITSKIKTDGPFAATLGITKSVNYCSGNYDLSDVETTLEVPGGTMVSWTATAKSNGPVTYS